MRPTPLASNAKPFHCKCGQRASRHRRERLRFSETPTGISSRRCVLSVPAKPGLHRRVTTTKSGSRIRSFHVERIVYSRALQGRAVAILEGGQLVEIYIERE